MVVYGYKPDTLVAVYPALQGTDTPRFHIFKNTAVYPADWLAENYRHYLKVRFVAIDDHTAVITGEYNMEQVKVWLEKYTSIKSLKTS